VKVALIPPKGWESYLTSSTGVLMALALETTMDSPAYMTAFKLLKTASTNKWIMLDNGAAEGQQCKNGALIRFAAQLEADEIILPDVMGSRTETMSRVSDFFRNTKWDRELSYMGVVQGDSIRHAQQCVHEYAELIVRQRDFPNELRPIKTLGIPRRLITVTDSMSVRIDLAQWIQEQYPDRFGIHMLGAAGVWPQEVKYISKYAPFVRSIDTSLPFNFALAKVDLALLAPGAQLSRSRPPGYMVGRLINQAPKLVQKNIDTYLSWAKD